MDKNFNIDSNHKQNIIEKITQNKEIILTKLKFAIIIIDSKYLINNYKVDDRNNFNS